YATSPGISGTSARQRPSASCLMSSVSFTKGVLLSPSVNLRWRAANAPLRGVWAARPDCGGTQFAGRLGSTVSCQMHSACGALRGDESTRAPSRRACASARRGRPGGALAGKLRLHLVGRLRLAEEVPLHLVAAQQAQEARLLVRLHAFGHDVQLERVR